MIRQSGNRFAEKDHATLQDQARQDRFQSESIPPWRRPRGRRGCGCDERLVREFGGAQAGAGRRQNASPWRPSGDIPS
jgi:hypothetical protein